MATIDINQIMKKISPQIINSRANLAFGAALSKFNRIKRETINEFDVHPVTKEIESAESGGSPEDTENTSGLLNGKGNLFTFLGFERKRKPIEHLRNLLKEKITLINKPKATPEYDSVLFSFPIEIPSETAIEQETPMDWEGGNSWVAGIERDGVSGLSNYIYWKKFENPPSRSGGGIQVKHSLRDISMRTTKYLFDILKRLREKI